MLEILLLFFLCRKIGKIARERGLKPFRWQAYTVLAFFLMEGIGLNLALSWLEVGELKSMEQITQFMMQHPGVFLFSLFTAFGGYLLVRMILEKRPEVK